MEIYNINVIKNLNRHTAVTVGMFDGVHAGHRQIVRHLTENARERGLDPVVVTFSNHPRSLLRPDEQVSLLTTFDERMQLLEQCGVKTVVVMAFDNETAQLSACQFASRILCSKLNMKMLLLGYDNKFGSRYNDDFNKLPELATQKGFEIIHDEPLPMVALCVPQSDFSTLCVPQSANMTQSEYISSTKIRKALISGNIELANLMLRTPYSITGVVEHGHHIGTTLGFPTANISLTANTKLLPADGVYALRAFAEAREHDEQTFNFQLSTFNFQLPAIANLGSQPTFHQGRRTLEVHLLDFEGDLYGQTLRVEFLSRLRDIKQFSSPEALAAQLAIDRDQARQIIKS